MTRIALALSLAALVATTSLFVPSVAGAIDGLSESALWTAIGILSFILVLSAAWTILGGLDHETRLASPGDAASNSPNHQPARANDNGAGLSPRAA